MDVWSANVRHVALERRRRRAQRPAHLSLLSRARLLPHPSAGVPRLTLQRSLHRVRIPLHPSAARDRVWRRRVRLEAVPDGGRSDDAGAPPHRPRAGHLHTPIAPSAFTSVSHRTRLGRPAHPSSSPSHALDSSQAEWLGGLVSELEANSVGCAAPWQPRYPLLKCIAGRRSSAARRAVQGLGIGNSIGPHNEYRPTGTRRGTRSARPPARPPARLPARSTSHRRHHSRPLRRAASPIPPSSAAATRPTTAS